VIARIVDAASFQLGKPVAPGSYISIKGSNLVDSLSLINSSGDLAPFLPLPMNLDAVNVTFDIPGSYDGKPADYESPIIMAGDNYEPRCAEHFVLPGRPH